MCLNFYPRPPRGGRPELYTAGRLFNGISIHALREEGDAMRSTPSSTSSRFLSTPSARRATACENHRTRPECYFYPRPPRGGRHTAIHFMTSVIYFYPRPPRGGRPSSGAKTSNFGKISIHALREEGDDAHTSGSTTKKVFLSTPSARRATRSSSAQTSATREFLSTPSARRATDKSLPTRSRQRYFYPRPPRGGRPSFSLTAQKRF